MNDNIDNNKMDKSNQKCIISGKILYKTCLINELTLKYKIKGEQHDFNVFYDKKSKIFVHIISDIITDSMINKIKKNILIPCCV